MNYYALFYYVVDDFVARRAAYREEHLRLVREAQRRSALSPKTSPETTPMFPGGW